VEGLIVAASYADAANEEAVYRWLAWDSGQFRLTPLPTTPATSAMMGVWEELVLEAARRRDELEDAVAPLPPYPTRADLDALLAERPALSGLALLGDDGRLLGAVGIPADLVEQLPLIMIALRDIRHALNQQQPTVYAYGEHRLLFDVWQPGVLALALPAPGASLNEAVAHLQPTGSAREENHSQ
jgi:hypothetical protein